MEVADGSKGQSGVVVDPPGSPLPRVGDGGGGEVDRSAVSGVVAVLGRPWRGAVVWRPLAWEVLNVPLGFASAIGVGLLVGLSVAASVTFVVAVPLLWITFIIAASLGQLERWRAARLLGVKLTSPHGPIAAGGWLSRLRQLVTSASRWREIAYFLVGLPVQGLCGLLVVAMWSASLVLAVLPFDVIHAPGRYGRFGIFHLHSAGGTAAAVFGAIVGLAIVAPQATLVVAAAGRLIVRRLLGAHGPTALARRVDELEVSRGAAISIGEADRQRIARDLHDGAQQRLVALALDLGRARERLDTDPQRARQLLDDAQDEAAAALSELRDLVRGIHPAVLTDRGLDAALSALVARCPVPVSVSISLPARPPPAAESAAYFIVAEALTNVAKHAHATLVRVAMALSNGRLVIEVSDDGGGGADTSRGSGLAGLAERVSALGGWMRVLSPQGGPTTVMVELPCES
jgi:signal transduction histidine kinase